MTNQEASRILDGLKPNTAMAQGNETAYGIGQALSMAISALTFRDKAEVVISQLRADRDRLENELAEREQEPKTGHWINDEDTIGCYYCSECGGYVASYDDAYCKYCGAKMVEPQESEDKE